MRTCWQTVTVLDCSPCLTGHHASTRLCKLCVLWHPLSVEIETSLPEADVKFLDAYCEHKGLSSRSEALHHAVQLLRTSWLGPEYEAAWSEWKAEEEALWDSGSMELSNDEETLGPT